MAKLIPPINSCLSRMTSGEKRFAYRLEQKLTHDYWCWYDVSIGEHTRHPDFVIFHPQHGLLVLEVKDWKLGTLRDMNKQHAAILTSQGLKHVLNPLEQARQYMFAITSRLQRDDRLVWANGPLKGKLLFRYAHGVVLSNISRRQFENASLDGVLPPHLVVCQDEMTEGADAEVFQQRLWNMFPVPSQVTLSAPQIARLRWHLFPEIRIQAQQDMFAADGNIETEVPDLIRVMDLQQEQLARSLGDGHRVIHGVAGSGKTLILAYRAEHLAKICRRPILVLCYNKSLATKLAAVMESKGVHDKVHVVNFHAWCVRQLHAYQVAKPEADADRDAYFEACVEYVIRAVEHASIPAGQYDAVLIDEGHDFKPEWFKLAVRMIHPETNSLLVLYDDAQSIYGGPKKRRFSFSSVGVQAKGHTTILKLNYRNTVEILSVARAFADDLLTPQDTGEDQAPTVQPMSTGRHGPPPLLVKLPSLNEEAGHIADRIMEANRTGMAWSDIAVAYRRYAVGARVADVLERKGIPFHWPQNKAYPASSRDNAVHLITMHSIKGLEFTMVFIPHIGAPSKDEGELHEEARLLYVAMTRATDQLVMTYGDSSTLSEKLEKAMHVLRNL